MRSNIVFRLFGFSVFAAWLGLTSPLAFAHRIDVTAVVDHDGIHAEVKDSHGIAISEVSMEVTDPEGSVLARGETDAAGRFSFTLTSIPEHVNVVAKTVDGHRASLTLSREELTGEKHGVIGADSGAQAEEDQDHPHEHTAIDEHVGIPKIHSSSSMSPLLPSGLDDAEVLHSLLVRQQATLDDIQAQLLKMNRPKSGVSRESIVAGLGFIFGLTGMITAVYALRRASGKDI